MPIDAQIPLMVQTPRIASPLETMGSLMEVRSAMSDIALRNAQAQQAQQQTADIRAQAQQRQRDLDSTRKLQDVLADPANHDALANGDYSPIWKAGVSPNIGNPAITQLQAFAEKAQTLRTGQAAFHAAGRDQWMQSLRGVDSSDPAAADQLNGAVAVLAQDHPELARNIQPFAPGAGLADRIKNEINSNGLSGAFLKAQDEHEKEQSETGKNTAAQAASQAEAALNRAKTPGAQAESDIDKFKLQLIQDAGSAPASGGDAIDGILPANKFPTLNGSFKREYGEAGRGMIDPNGIAQARQAVIARAVDMAKEVAPEILAAAANKAGLEANARVPAEVIAAVQTEAAKARLAPGAVGGIPDPAMQREAMQQADLADKNWTDKAASGATLRSTVQLAEEGNKAAPPMATIDQLRMAVNRVNRQELEQVSGAGNLYDRVSGWLGGWTEGQPIPPAILKDMGALANASDKTADTMRGVAYRNINQRYGAKFADNTADLRKTMGGQARVPAAVAAVLKNAGPGIHTLSDGSKWMKAADGSIAPQ